VALFVLMLLRVPVGMAMGMVGVTGFGYIVGSGPALKMVGQTSMRTVTDWNFAVVPLFLLMGSFATTSGMSRELFRAANALLGHLRGGLGIATIAACGGFAAICGSSVATAATFSRVAYPEMRRYGYPQSFATGVIAAGGSSIMIRLPVLPFRAITGQDIGCCSSGICGISPSSCTCDRHRDQLSKPGYLPAGVPPRAATGRRAQWATLLPTFVIGGIPDSLRPRGNGWSARCLLLGIARRRLSRPISRSCRRRDDHGCSVHRSDRAICSATPYHHANAR
jgi:hypothetical protein